MKKKKPRVDLTITTNHVLAATAVGVVIFTLYRVRKVVAENIKKVNPANRENVVNQAVQGVVGEENLANATDKIFAVVDLVNPFNESDRYAREVLGLSGGDER